MSSEFKNKPKVQIDRKKKLDGLRGSLKGAQKEEALFTTWKEQEAKEAESKKLEAEYKQAKKKLKETRKQFLKDVVSSFPDAEKVIQSSKRQLKKKQPFIKKNKKRILATTGVLALLLVVMIGARQTSNTDSTATLGAETANTSEAVPELPKVEESKTDFELLYPSGADSSLYEVVLVSPEGAAPAYTYLDRIEEDGPVIRVTQQEIPDDFNIEEVAESFQATNTIQVDEAKIKHGYSERGRVQSLFFIKENLLVSIRSPQLYEDDIWVSYYLRLKK